MRERQEGQRVAYRVTYLEMTAPPSGPPPPPPPGCAATLVEAEAPSAEDFLCLYRAVGGPWEWTDWLDRPRAEVEAFVMDPRVALHRLMLDGRPGGFFVLDTRVPRVCELAYFGLVPEATGRGLGPWMLGTAVRKGWARPGVERMTVNTCTLDHPAALGLYRRSGFAPVAQEDRSRVLTRRRPAS